VRGGILTIARSAFPTSIALTDHGPSHAGADYIRHPDLLAAHDRRG
jgi:hypothetical protein